jgi:hypothetical protein
MEHTIQNLNDLEALVLAAELSSEELLAIFEKAFRIRYLTQERRNLPPRLLFEAFRLDFNKYEKEISRRGEIPIWLDVKLEVLSSSP